MFVLYRFVLNSKGEKYMQINAVSSQSFKGWDSELMNFDVEKAEQITDALRKLEGDRFESTEKKSKLQTAFSVVVGALALFLLGRKGFSKISNFASNLLQNENTVKYIEKTKELASNFLNKHGKINSVVSKIQTAGSTIQDKFINKVGAANLAGGATAIAGTAYVASTDSNENGIADIAEKGVNAYKGAVEKLGVVKTVVDAIA